MHVCIVQANGTIYRDDAGEGTVELDKVDCSAIADLIKNPDTPLALRVRLALQLMRFDHTDDQSVVEARRADASLLMRYINAAMYNRNDPKQ